MLALVAAQRRAANSLIVVLAVAGLPVPYQHLIRQRDIWQIRSEFARRSAVIAWPRKRVAGARARFRQRKALIFEVVALRHQILVLGQALVKQLPLSLDTASRQSVSGPVPGVRTHSAPPHSLYILPTVWRRPQFRAGRGAFPLEAHRREQAQAESARFERDFLRAKKIRFASGPKRFPRRPSTIHRLFEWR